MKRPTNPGGASGLAKRGRRADRQGPSGESYGESSFMLVEDWSISPQGVSSCGFDWLGGAEGSG